MSRVRMRHLLVLTVAVCGWTTAAQAQQHSYAPADIEAGRALYRANCLGCHGDRGDAVAGTDLSTGRYRHGSTDEDLIRIIRNGIPNTPMAPHTHLSVGQARSLVAFLRSLPSGAALVLDEREVRIGDAGRGKKLFFGEADCASCHGMNGGGNLLSPGLDGIGAQRSPASLQLALLQPNAEVRPEQRFYRVVTAQGREVTGRLLNQDTHSVQMLSEEQQLESFQKSELSAHGFIDSPMPSYQELLNEDAVADLVAYLLTLTGETE